MPPAARVGDLTVHGGTIVAGAATVFIEGMPAARQGDMHVCPMCNPGTPPPPHVGGPVSLGSTSVTIEGMPAARMGDMCICNGPPDTIAMGATSVIIGDGGNPVIIGGGGGITKIGGGGGMTIIGGGTASGGGGGGGGDNALLTAAKYSAAAAQSLTPEATELEVPFLAAQFTGAAAPIARTWCHVADADGNEDTRMLPGNGQVLNGRLQAEGDSELSMRQLHTVRWSTETARVGDEVTITAQAPGFDDGTEVLICIEQLSRRGSGTDTAEVIEACISGEMIEATWTYGTSYGHTDAPTEVDTDRPVADQMPVYRAEMTVLSASVQRSTGLLRYQSTLKTQVQRPSTGEPVADVPYRLLLSDGEVRTGTTTPDGWIEEEDVPPGDHEIAW